MNTLRTIIAGLFRRLRAESEMAQELAFHMERRAEDLMRSGISATEAQRKARLEFGGVEGYKEQCREARGFRILDEMRGDVHYALRTPRKSPGFTAVAALSLALGIGMNLSCFVFLNAMIFHPFPYPYLDRIMTLWETPAKHRTERNPVSPANFIDWKEASRSFERLASYREWDVNLTGVDHPDHIQATQVSPEFFQILGMQPIMGRTFSTQESEPGRDGVAVLSKGFWRTRLASVPNAIGSSISLSGRKYIVVGIMPDDFDFPLASEIWTPLALTREEQNQRTIQQLGVIGTLKPDVSVAQVSADMSDIARRLEQRYLKTNEEKGVFVTPLRELTQTENARFLGVLMGAALFVLLLACTNVGSLQVARATARQKEIGLRRALGASQFRIVRQLLTESLFIGVLGGILGLALAEWNLKFRLASIPVMVFRLIAGLRQVHMTAQDLAFAFGLSMIAGALCCLPAIFQLVRERTSTGLNDALKDGGRSSTASRSRNRLRSGLVIAEVALAFILLVAAGLMVGTFQRMLTLDLGFNSKNLLTAEISLSGRQYRDTARIAAFYDSVMRNVSGLPGIRATAASANLGAADSLSIEGRSQPGLAERQAGALPQVKAVSPQYLKAMGISLLQGRPISEQDGPDAPPAVVLSETVVRHYWPSGNPVGYRIKLKGPESPWLTIVGVTGDTKDWFFGNPMPMAYTSYRQFPQRSMALIVRTSHDPMNMANAVRRQVENVDRDEPLYNVKTMEEVISDEASGVRSAASMMSTYAAIALLLAISGIYSISSFFVAQRTREIGVRMTLGATRRGIVNMVLAQSFRMAAIGLSLGLPLAILLTMGMSHILLNIFKLEPMTFVLLTRVLGGSALVAGYLPAWRAAKVDPMVALREE
jgi:putative ABC transport system permease protein